MDKQVMLAVAGAGKTYHICHTINPKNKNLILAYTKENIHNIKMELKNAWGEIPEGTSVMTFDSFVYRFLVLPYEPTIVSYFGCEGFKSNGITMMASPLQRIKKNGKYVSNYKYKKKDTIGHYVTKDNRYYCDTLSELVIYVKSKLMNRAIARLNLFYDHIYIDEFQDFRKYKYEIILELSRRVNNILLVGDYNQHSVSANNNSGIPFGKNVSYHDFVELLKKKRFYVDDVTLRKSRRCSKNVCAFVRDKLGIDIESSGYNHGEIIWVKDGDVDDVLKDSTILKLVNKNAAQYSFESMNWSYSKGDTVNKACVILTKNTERLDEDFFSIEDVPIVTKNQLYVALTRSRGDLYLMKESTFRKYKKNYTKINND